jgi:hypothetical protein
MTYIQYITLTAEQNDFLSETCQGDPDLKGVLSHIIGNYTASENSWKRSAYHEGVPIPFNSFLRRYFNDVSLDPLLQSGILGLKSQHRPGKCRIYSLDYDFLCRFLRTKSDYTKPMVSSRGWKPAAQKRSRLTDEHKNAYPALVRSALLAIESIPVDKAELIKALQEENSKLDTSDPRTVLNTTVLRSILHQCGSRSSYLPIYRVRATGRLFESKGIQNLPKSLRGRILAGTGVLNYDLEKSQANGLLQSFKEHGITCRWLERYASDAAFRAQLVEDSCLSPKNFKTLLYALVFKGINYRDLLTVKRYSRSTVYRDLWEDTGSDIAIRQSLRIFQLLTKELETCLLDWQDRLYSKLATKQRWVTNACGMALEHRANMTHPQLVKFKRKLAAHILQGRESAFIHHLTANASKHGFKVVSNFHDGVLTIGEVPPAAVEEARLAAGLDVARLVQKDLGE